MWLHLVRPFEDNVKDIYLKCIEFKEKNEYIMTNFENYIFTSQDPLKNLAEVFEITLNRKSVEF